MSESQHSFLNILASLILVSVLSIGAVLGYSATLNRHRANKIIETASRLSILAQTANAGEGGIINIKESDISYTPLGGVLDMTAYPNGNVILKTPYQKISKIIKNILGERFNLYENIIYFAQ